MGKRQVQVYMGSYVPQRLIVIHSHKQRSQWCVFNVTSLRNTVWSYYCICNDVMVLMLDFKIVVGWEGAHLEFNSSHPNIIHNSIHFIFHWNTNYLLSGQWLKKKKDCSLTDISQCPVDLLAFQDGHNCGTACSLPFSTIELLLQKQELQQVLLEARWGRNHTASCFLYEHFHWRMNSRQDI